MPSTPCVSWPPTPSRRSATATPGPRSASPLPRTCCTSASCGTIRPTRRGSAATASSSPPGHSSLTQYIQLYLAGYGLELSDLEALRTWGSLTPGHPEYGHTSGVEITTGPLGQGIASSVGFAMAARRERGLLDPDAAPGTSPFDHFVYVIASDGDLQEGVSSRGVVRRRAPRSSGNLIVIWDDNKISIEGHTDVAFTEDVLARYEAYGWHTQSVDWTHGGTEYREDPAALLEAIEAAKAVTDKPSFIRLRTIIAWPSPTKQDTHGSHGSKLGTEEVAGLKKVLGFDPEKTFEVSPEVITHTRAMVRRGEAIHAEWDAGYRDWREANPERAALLDRLRAKQLPEGWTDALPTFEAGGSIATRAASGERPRARWRPCCPSCGAARPTWPARTTRR